MFAKHVSDHSKNNQIQRARGTMQMENCSKNRIPEGLRRKIK